MAIIIPTSYSTFGDATSTPCGKYVLAQLRSDADMSWVHDLRAFLVIDELKWKVFKPRREQIQANTALWSRIVSAMARATIVVIDPQPVETAIRDALRQEGAEEGYDYNQSELIDKCAGALVKGTPVAYLPSELSLRLGVDPNRFVPFERFTPDAIRAQIGRGLRHAKIFAARAHAMFDVESSASAVVSGATRSPLSSVVLVELMSVERGFDKEDQASLDVLNDASNVIADAMQSVVLTPGQYSDQPLVAEYGSKDVDHLQAADIAAGWASELVTLGDERALLGRFERVLLNGVLLR